MEPNQVPGVFFPTWFFLAQSCKQESPRFVTAQPACGESAQFPQPPRPAVGPLSLAFNASPSDSLQNGHS